MYRIQSTRRRILAMLLCLALLVSVLPTFALGAEEKGPLEKLHVKLVEALQNASATDQIPVWIWLDGPSRLALEDMIAQECGPEPGQGCTAEEANAYLAARRAVIGREHLAYNEKFMAEVLPEVSASDIGYFSKYTATIGAYLTVAQIRAAAYDPRVNELSLYEDHPLVSGGEEEEPLTLEEQICRDYYRFLTQSGRIREIEFWLDPDSPEGKRLYPSDVRIDVDYGEWNGWRVLMMDPRSDEMGMCEAYLRIGNFWFSCCYEVADLMFVAWKDGQVLPVYEAYKQGLLTCDDLYGLFQRHYRDRSIPFQDVDPQAWYAEAVNYAYHCSIFNGMALNRFNPSGTMTRAMLVTVLHRQNGMPFEGSNPFTDVPAQSWYTDAVAWAAEKKIVNGVGGGRFAPEAPLTREQLVTILYRMYGAEDDAPALRGYPDAGDVSQWADAAVRWAVAEGILRGVPHSDGRTCLDPGSPVTRAQAATLLLRIALRGPETAK